MNRIGTYVLWGSLSLGLGLLPGCAATQKQAQHDAIDQNSAALLRQQALNFTQALFHQETAKVLALSAYPFFFDNKAIFDSAADWEQVLAQTSLNTQPADVQISSLNLYTPDMLRKEHPVLWAKLLEYNFEEKYYLLAQVQTLQAQTRQILYQENVLLLLDPQSKKICGFVH